MTAASAPNAATSYAAEGRSGAARSREARVARALARLSPDRAERVERALAELRSGRPVLIVEREASHALLALGVEALDDDLADAVSDLAGGRARLVLTAERLRALGAEISGEPARRGNGAVALPVVEVGAVQRLGLDVDAAGSALETPALEGPVASATALDETALELARLALVAPAVLAVPVGADEVPADAVLRVDASAVRAYRALGLSELRIVGRAPVPLEGAPDTEFVVFRGGEGLRDQVAIVVGRPDLSQPVPVRLHSACLTGDLFGSLKCDCGDQLRRTVRAMAERGPGFENGGILLYLDQEGRGNGLANKIRAYALQADGFDTFDADAALGFGLDGRRFDFAAAMLRLLGVGRVKALTNNPLKICALREGGLDVVGNARVLGRLTPENTGYLAAKRDRAGHLLDLKGHPDPSGARALPPGE